MNADPINHAEVVRMIEQMDRRSLERIGALDKRIDDRFIATEKQTELALVQSDKVGAKADAAVSGLLGTYMPRTEFATRHEILANAIDELKSRADKAEGALIGINRTVSLLGAGLGILMALIAIFEFVSRIKTP